MSLRINREKDLARTRVELPGAEGVFMTILVGPEHGSDRIVMRLFTVMPGGRTPYHSHDFEHLVRIESGRGAVLDADGAEHPVAPGQSLWVGPNAVHGFKNAGREPFEFICVIPAQP